MNNPQDTNSPIFTGQVGTPVGTDLRPHGPGVNFTTTTASITVPFTPGVTPIVTQVTVPPNNTNVNGITVTIRGPDGTPIVGPTTSKSGNTVTAFPVVPLPANSTLTVNFTTSDGRPAENVTLSVIACYTPSTAATVVSTGTPSGRPTATTVSTGTGTGAQTTLIISTTTSGGTQGISSTTSIFTLSSF